MSNDPLTSRDDVRSELELLRARVRGLERRASWRTGALVALVVLGATMSRAQLTTFNADSPALATEVNGNFTQLKTWLETKVGFVTTGGEVRMRTTTANPVLVASSAVTNNTSLIAEFRRETQAQGVGITSDGLVATGTAANQALQLTPKGASSIVLNGPVSVAGNTAMNGNANISGSASVGGNASVGGTIDIGLEMVTCSNIASGIDCACPSGKRALGGGAYCAGDNNHLNTAYFSSTTTMAAWCENPSGTNLLVTVNIICARVL